MIKPVPDRQESIAGIILLKMFKLRLHTCRVILLTSLVWFLGVVIILSLYSTDCLGGNCKKSGEYDVEVREPLVNNENSGSNKDEKENQIDEIEPEGEIKRWEFLLKKLKIFDIFLIKCLF